MKTRELARLTLLLLASVVTGCATPMDEAHVANDNLNATLWVQVSTEYAAAAEGSYAAARAAATVLAQAQPEQVAHMAVVLDVDETVLDNVRYQAQVVADNTSYESDSWDRWIAEQAASAVPGAVQFIAHSQSLGFHVALITNRKCKDRAEGFDDCVQKQETIANLESLGIDTSAMTIMLRNEVPPAPCQNLLSDVEAESGVWSSDKTSRRRCLALGYRPVMYFGDQLGDFPLEDHAASNIDGLELARAFSDYWGSRWFMLPNPTYGDWLPRTTEERRGLLRGID